MTVVIFENTEDIPHLIKTQKELVKKHPEIRDWEYVLFSRCPRCNKLFASTTDRKYCSKECQYNKKKEVSTKNDLSI